MTKKERPLLEARKVARPPRDPEVEALTVEIVQAQADDFESLLDRCVTEHEIHEFLANNSYFFNSAMRMYGASPLYSKVQLGSDYVTDFAWFDSGSFGPEWCFVEIESPANPMFTAGGEPSATLTHAIQQVRDWHAWVHENLDYARKLMPHIEYPMAYVFVGRRRELSSTNAKRLKRLAYDNRMSMEIHTLDWFVGAAHSVVPLIESSGRGDWTVPLKAFSHSDLAEGRPEHALEYLDLPRDWQRLLQSRLQDRRTRYLFWPEEAEPDIEE